MDGPGRVHTRDRHRDGLFLRQQARQSTPLVCFVLAATYAALAVVNIVASTDGSTLGHALDVAATLLLVGVGALVGCDVVPAVLVPWLVAGLAVGLVEVLLVQSWENTANLGIQYAILLMVMYAPFTFAWTPAALAAGAMIASYAVVAVRVFGEGAQDQVVLAASALILGLVLLGLRLRSMRHLLDTIDAVESNATHDSLTDLPNRAVFQRRLTAILEKESGDLHPTVVANVDLDRFKVVNETLGHPYGDKVLIEIARRLSGHLGGEDCVARLGGDEFGVILRACPDPAAALWGVKELIERQVAVEGFPTVSLNCSFGYVLAVEDGDSVDSLLQRAEIAMYIAKDQHVGVQRYDPLQDHHDASALSLITEVRRAIDADELVLHYQPQVHLFDERPIALEALVRWQHPVLGLLAPDQFIPLVEQTDLIHDFTDWVLTRALRDLAALGELAGDLAVAVNISARNLARSDFTDRVATSIAASSIGPERLILEITETAFLAHPARASNVLLAINALGVRVSLDDFGVGQTSLSYVAALPIAEFKIDKSFVTDMTDNPVHAAIVKSIVELGRGLSMHVVAEGVETASAATALANLGCDIAQGYLFSKPLTLAAVHKWLQSAQSR